MLSKLLFIAASGRGGFYLAPSSTHGLTQGIHRSHGAQPRSVVTWRLPQQVPFANIMNTGSHSASYNSQTISADGENHLYIFHSKSMGQWGENNQNLAKLSTLI